MSIAVVATATETIDHRSKQGKSLLRSIVRCSELYPHSWALRASKAGLWRIRFERCVRGKSGQPDSYCTAVLDSKVIQHGRVGWVRPFDDASEVVVPECQSIFLAHDDCKLAAQFLLDGWTLAVVASCGSTSSSAHGISTLSLHAYPPFLVGTSVVIGGQTLVVNGHRVICGACDF